MKNVKIYILIIIRCTCVQDKSGQTSPKPEEVTFFICADAPRLMTRLLIRIRHNRICLASEFLYSRRNSSHVSLNISPQFSLLDEEVTITATSLRPRSVVKLETRLVNPEERFSFASSSSFRVGEHGSLSTADDAPLEDSSYQGAHGSGPLWSVQSLPGFRPRLWPRNIEDKLTYEITLSEAGTEEVLASGQTVKSYVGPGVMRVVVREGSLTLSFQVSGE